MSDFDLDELDKLHEAATPAPWYAHATDDEYFMNARYVGTRPSDNCHDDGNGLAAGWPDQEPPESVIAITLLQQPRLADNNKCDENMLLIAALRNSYPRLAAEIRRLTAENARMRSALEEIAIDKSEIGGYWWDDVDDMQALARRALAGGEEASDDRTE